MAMLQRVIGCSTSKTITLGIVKHLKYHSRQTPYMPYNKPIENKLELILTLTTYTFCFII